MSYLNGVAKCAAGVANWHDPALHNFHAARVFEQDENGTTEDTENTEQKPTMRGQAERKFRRKILLFQPPCFPRLPWFSLHRPGIQVELPLKAAHESVVIKLCHEIC